MTPQQIVAVAIRLFAIWFGFSTLMGAAFELPSWVNHGYPLWQPLVLAATLFLICGLIWQFPLTIATKLVPRESVKVETPMTTESLARAAIAVIGLAYLVSGIVSVLLLLVATTNQSDGMPTMNLFSSGFLPVFGSRLISVVAGAILLSNSRRIAAACAGTQRAPVAEKIDS